MKALKPLLFVSISIILVSLTSCGKEDSPLCDYWYVDPHKTYDTDYYRFGDDGRGSYYDDNYANKGSLSCDFTWEADDTYLILYYNYYNSYSENRVKKTNLYYYAISGKNLILYDQNFKYVGIYTKK